MILLGSSGASAKGNTEEATPSHTVKLAKPNTEARETEEGTVQSTDARGTSCVITSMRNNSEETKGPYPDKTAMPFVGIQMNAVERTPTNFEQQGTCPAAFGPLPAGNTPCGPHTPQWRRSDRVAGSRPAQICRSGIADLSSTSQRTLPGELKGRKKLQAASVHALQFREDPAKCTADETEVETCTKCECEVALELLCNAERRKFATGKRKKKNLKLRVCDTIHNETSCQIQESDDRCMMSAHSNR